MLRLFVNGTEDCRSVEVYFLPGKGEGVAGLTNRIPTISCTEIGRKATKFAAHATMNTSANSTILYIGK